MLVAGLRAQSSRFIFEQNTLSQRKLIPRVCVCPLLFPYFDDQTEPHSVELLNSLCRMLHQVRLEGSTRLYIRRLAQNNPTSAPLGLMAGQHTYSDNTSHAEE
jgi:hypothetical protein